MRNKIINHFEGDIGKFVQVRIKGEIYFWTGPGSILHGKILKELLDELKIDYKTWGEFNEGHETKIPLNKGKNYELVGAGWFSRSGNEIQLYGKSQSYNIGPNKEHANEISKLTGLNFVI